MSTNSDSAARAPLTGLRLLVVEDTLLVAEAITEALRDGGAEVLGPVGRLAAAKALAASETFHGALLDVNLAGERCFPVAEILLARGIPFAFLTGYGDTSIPDHLRAQPRLAKPFQLGDLLHLAERLPQGRDGARPNGAVPQRPGSKAAVER